MEEPTQDQIIENLKKESQYYKNKFIEFKNRFVELEQKTLKYKVFKIIDKVMSTLKVLLSSEGSGFGTRLKMFLSTFLKWAKNGFKFEEEQVQKARLSICNSCPELIKPRYQCKICGCMMKTKTKISGASCPLKKW